MINFIDKGGIINWVLVISYFFVLAIVLERIIYFFKIRGNFEKFKQIVLAKLSQNSDINKETSFLKKFSKTHYLEVLTIYLKYNKISTRKLNEKLNESNTVISSKMNQNLWLLSLIGHLAPLMGLMGTMTGLIRSFKAMESLGGSVDISALAGGIWEAMLTTVMGLIVAIISFLFFRIFENHIEKKVDNINILLANLNSFFHTSINSEFQESNNNSGVDDEIL